MKLKKLTLTNFRSYENFEINFNKKLNVIVAENGAGKTTILDAIAIGYGAMLTRFPKVKGKTFEESDLKFDDENRLSPYMRVELESYHNVIWDRTHARNKSKAVKKLIPEAIGLTQLHEMIDNMVEAEYEQGYIEFEMPLVMYYGTSRAVLKSPMRNRNFKKDFSRYEALTGSIEAYTNFTRLFQWFTAMQNEENQDIKDRRDFDYKLPALEAVRRAIEVILPEMINPRIKRSPLRFVIDKVVEGKNVTFRVDQLSDGYKTVLAMVMDISARMAEANPHLEENSNNSEALIMIDEVDLHLHPRWQQTILIDLQRAFPHAQFIVTTHSPQVLTTVSRKHIRVITFNEAIEPQISPLARESADALAYIMNTNVKPPLDILENIHRYEQLVKNGEIESPLAKSIKKEFDEIGYEIPKQDLELWQFLAEQQNG